MAFHRFVEIVNSNIGINWQNSHVYFRLFDITSRRPIDNIRHCSAGSYRFFDNWLVADSSQHLLAQTFREKLTAYWSAIFWLEMCLVRKLYFPSAFEFQN